MARDEDIELYMRGYCHVHAVAAVQAHGGFFAICYDESEPYYEDEGDCIPSVLHVWSVHETAEGQMARDVMGDFRFSTENLRARLEAFFPDLEGAFEFGDARIDDRAVLEEVMSLSGDGLHHPLCGIRQEEIDETLQIESVSSIPGTNPAPSIEDLRAMALEHAAAEERRLAEARGDRASPG